jgi:hypothetical protein
MPRLDSATATSLIKANIEDDGLDFKRTLDIQRKHDQAELIKDVLAMANTVRATENPSYIIIGAKDGIAYDISGLRLDDASIQQILNTRIDHALTFSYYQLEIEPSTTIGVIEIPRSADKPHFVKDDFTDNDKVLLHKGMCPVRQGSSTKIALKDDYDRIYEERLEWERSKMAERAFRYVRELETQSDVDPITLDLGDVAKSASKFIQKKENSSVLAMISTLRKSVIDTWRSTSGRGAEEVSTIKNAFVEPTVLKIAVVGCYLIEYDVKELFSEILNSLTAIYQLANYAELGVQGTVQHLDRTVPSKSAMKALYILGALTILNKRFELTKKILEQKVEITLYYQSTETLIRDPLASTTQGDFFKEARDAIASNESLFDFFDKDENMMMNCLCRFDLLTGLTLFSKNESELHITRFANYGQSRVSPMMEDIRSDPVQYSVLFSDPTKLLSLYLEKLTQLIKENPITYLGWRF